MSGTSYAMILVNYYGITVGIIWPHFHRS